MAKFAPGDIVTYYHPKKTEDDNRHWPAEVIALTANRYRVKVLAPPQPFVRLVSERRLARQDELTL